MKILGNPLLLRAVAVFCFGVFGFLVGLIFIRRLRKTIQEEADLGAGPRASLETLPLHVYSTVIQQLKQQKHELEIQSQAEQHREIRRLLEILVREDVKK